jgi:hypothetical protein
MKFDRSFDKLMRLRKGVSKPEVESVKPGVEKFEGLFESLMKARKDILESTAVVDLVKVSEVKMGDLVRGRDHRARMVVDVFFIEGNQVEITYKDSKREIYRGDDEVEKLTIE